MNVRKRITDESIKEEQWQTYKNFLENIAKLYPSFKEACQKRPSSIGQFFQDMTIYSFKKANKEAKSDSGQLKNLWM